MSQTILPGTSGVAGSQRIAFLTSREQLRSCSLPHGHQDTCQLCGSNGFGVAVYLDNLLEE